MLAVEDALRQPWWRLRLSGGLEETFDSEVGPARARYMQPWLLILIVCNLAGLQVEYDLLGPEAFRLPAYLTLFVLVPVAIAGILALSGRPSPTRQSAVIIATVLTNLVIMLNSARIAPPGHTDTYLLLAASVPLVVGLIAPLPFRYTLALALASFGTYAGFVIGFGLVEIGHVGVAWLVSTLILIPPKLSWIRERDAKRGFLLGLRAQLSAAALLEANAQLQILSESDALTGIANRRQFALELERGWRKACQEGTWFAALLLDIDHFKLFNDSAGHAAGDRCLAKVATALEAGVMRCGGLLARYGGEEFVVLLPGIDAQVAASVAEYLRRAVQNLAVPHPGFTDGTVVTVSVGVASGKCAHGLASGPLLSAADEALYEAKRLGRNRVVVSGERPAAPPEQALAAA